jgi:surface antigen
LYQGYGHYFYDDDAYKWLAFTAIAVKLLDNLNEQQQREHEAAQVYATTAPIGETIYWSEGNASGYVTPTREGTSSAGRYCREFQHEVTIGGRKEQSYGTACRQPDGSWEVISTGQ